MTYLLVHKIRYKVNPTWTGKILLSNRPKLFMSANSIITLIELVGIEPTF